VPANSKQKQKGTAFHGDPRRSPNELWGNERSLVFGALTVVVLAALALRLHALNLKPLSLSEALSVEVARLPLGDFWQTLWRIQPSMALYCAVLREWMRLGASEAWIRGLSVLASVATIPFIYVIGRRLYGIGAGLIAAVLLAVNVPHIRYAQEANSFSLALLLATAATFFFVAAVQDAKERDWKWYIGLGVASVYAHFLSVLVLVAHWASLQALKPSQSRKKLYRRALMWMTVLSLPLWVALWIHGRQLTWISRPRSFGLHQLLSSMTGNFVPWLALTYAAYAACWALASWAFVKTWRAKGDSGNSRKSSAKSHDKSPGEFENAWRTAVPLAWLLVPVAIALVASIAHPEVSRPFFISVPAVALAAAAGIDQLRPRLLMLPAVLVVLFLAALGVRSFQQRVQATSVQANGGDFRALTWYVMQAAGPHDAVLFDPPIDRVGYDYYAGRFPGAQATPVVVFPSLSNRKAIRGLEDLWRTPQSLSPDFYAALANDYSRVWLVKGQSAPGVADKAAESIETGLAKDFQLREVLHFPALYLKLYERARTPEQSGGISHK
jgi:mannosyltransferase